MEKSVYSSTKKPLQSASFGSGAQWSEESGWTAYLEDPSGANDAEEAYSFGSSSLVSDAASHAAWKVSNADNPAVSAGDVLKIPKKLNFKPKPGRFFIDTSLEDTASSPDNSPKVADLGPFDANNYQRKTDDYISSSLGKGRTMAENYAAGERNLQMSFKGKANGYTDLKKRGLCLVPLSMLANYLG